MKKYNIKHGIGKARYVLNFHDGVSTHKDGSPFWDMRIFSNQRDLYRKEKELVADGYIKN